MQFVKGEEKDWLDGCVPWTGKEKFLPTGASLPPGMPQNYDFFMLIKSWKVLRDGEISWVKTSDLKDMPNAMILGAEPNNEAIRALLDTWGEDQFLFSDSHGRQSTPKAWARKYGKNPFVALAVMRISRSRG